MSVRAGCLRVLLRCYSRYRYTDRVTIPAGRYIIGFNASARVGALSAAVAIDDVVLLEGSCDIQGNTTVCSVHECTCAACVASTCFLT